MAKKIPIPRAKTKMGFLDKLFSGIGGLSAVINHPNLRRSIQGTTPSGQRAAAAMLRKYGKWGTRGMGLLNPWTAVPYALLAGAQYGVGKAFDPYRDETGKIGTEGHARLAMAARAREQGLRREDMDLEPFLRAQQELELNRPTYQQLRESFLARQNQSEGGIARLL